MTVKADSSASQNEQSTPIHLPIALDAVGGDNGAVPNVEGAVMAAKAGVRVLLVGDQVKLHAELSKHAGSSSLPLEVIDAPDVIGMDEHASDVRGRKEASINVAVQLVKAGKAAAVVSMGHSGASMAASLLTLGRLPGIDRPAILTYIPARTGPVALLDAGANADVKAAYLVQWAQLASMYLRVIEERENPTVGLLSIGEEAHKGNAITLEAHALLQKLNNINFYGNIEGGDIFKGTTDIVLTDGFTGNIVLKLAEGEAKILLGWVKDTLMSSARAKLGGLLVQDGIRAIAERMDPSTYGASILLGVRGLSYIGHGSANSKAVKNALLRASRAHQSRLIERLTEHLSQQVSSAPSNEATR